MPGRSPYLPITRKFFESDPVAAVQVLETMNEAEAVTVLKGLPLSLASSVFPRLQVNYAASLLKSSSPEMFKDIVEKIDPQQGAVVLLALPEEYRKEFLILLKEDTRKHIQEFLTYPENSAGRIMSTDFIAFRTEVKVRESVQKIRALARTKQATSYVYVLDYEEHLVGVMYMRDIVVATGDETLGSLMRTDVFKIDAFMDREDVSNELSKRHFFAAPVVDRDNRLLGVVRSDQLITHVQSEATEDILKMVGAGEDEQAFSSIYFSMRKRTPWLYVNLATAFLAASVIGMFEGIISKITVLAIFLPVVAGQGGNAGAQSLAVVMRGLVMREVSPRKYKRLVIKEATIGLLNGLFIGSVTAGVAWMWHGNPFLGVVIGLAMIVNLVAAGFFGALIPLTLKALGRDPAQSSIIVLTTVTDVLGFFSFLGFAVLFQNKLM